MKPSEIKNQSEKVIPSLTVSKTTKLIKDELNLAVNKKNEFEKFLRKKIEKNCSNVGEERVKRKKTIHGESCYRHNSANATNSLRGEKMKESADLKLDFKTCKIC